MARKGRVDRGLFQKPNSVGKPQWYVRLYHEGKEQRFGAFPTKTKAREFYEKAKLDQQDGRFFPERYKRAGHVTLKEAIDNYMTVNTNRSIRDDWRFGKFWVEKFPNTPLRCIAPEDLERIKRELLTKGLSHQTVVHYLKFLRHLFNVAKISPNPVSQVTFPKVSKGRIRYLSIEEEQRLYLSIGSPYADWVRFAILTGLRRQEQFSLKWTDIELELGLITLRETKSGEVQYLHLSPEAKNLLQGMTSWQASVWVFPSPIMGHHRDAGSFYRRRFIPAVKKAGLEDVTWHTLRHTFASRLAMAGATEREIADCLRHSSTILVKRYAHLSPTHLRGIMERVSSFGTVPKTGSVTNEEAKQLV